MKTNLILLLIALIFGAAGVSGQQRASDLYQNPGTDDFATIKTNVEKYFAGKDKGRGSGYKQWKRWEFEMARRLTPDGKVTNWTLRNWNEHYAYLRSHANLDGSDPDATGGYWAGLGPFSTIKGAGHNPGMGRVNCIAFHPSDPQTFWIGAPAGGLWKTTDGGASWTPLTDGMPSIGVSGIAVDYTNPDILYILTGDGDGGNTYFTGVLKSTDGGETWMSTGISAPVQNQVRGYKMIIHPADPNILFVVFNAGIYKTSNGGQSWQRVQPGNFQDIEFKPGDPAIMYASGGTEFFRSSNTGSSWERLLYSGVPEHAERMAIGVSPASPSDVYLLAGPHTGIGSFTGVFRSENSGIIFTPRTKYPNILGADEFGHDSLDQSWYDLSIAVSRVNVNNVMIGGINTWASSNGGYDSTGWHLTSMWAKAVTGYGWTHGDIHNLDINPLNNNLYCCSDGGVFRSTDFGENWTDLSAGLAITQWYRIAGFEGNANLVIGGTQDNGSNKWDGGTSMLHILGADGFDCMIDDYYSNIMYYSAQSGDIFKSVDGGITPVQITPPGSAGPWLTPYLMDPNDHLKLYGGYVDGVYKSNFGGANWVNMGVSGCSAMAMGTDNSNRLYAAMDTGQPVRVHRLWRSDNGGSTWLQVRTGLPDIDITFLAVDPDNSLSVYAAFPGYSAGEKVYHSVNGGATWTNISGTLPNVPVHCIAFQDNNGSPGNALYIGTDIGVFYRDDNHTDWIPFRNGLPTIPVFDLEINMTGSVITAGTFGRGLWRSPLYTECPAGYTLTPANNPGNPNYTGYQFYEAGNDITSTRTITGGPGTDVTYKSNNYVKLLTGFHAREHNVFRATLGPCNTGTPGQNTVIRVKGRYAGELP
ncbi:MAG: hypothetical protein NT040_04045 [Bacteroidetes bacterium]|nr:hypothetical protein [Bacteroidota bacterium]